jgi:hypothetical protein
MWQLVRLTLVVLNSQRLKVKSKTGQAKQMKHEARHHLSFQKVRPERVLANQKNSG